MPESAVEFYVDAKGEHRWRVKAANGEILAESSEGYVAKADAERGYELTLASADSLPVEKA
jgi:uncharacterized protein YegP (UPF0339 family)